MFRWLLGIAVSFSTSPWDSTTLPHPQIDFAQCNLSKPGYFCDPGYLWSREAADAVATAIRQTLKELNNQVVISIVVVDDVISREEPQLACDIIDEYWTPPNREIVQIVVDPTVGATLCSREVGEVVDEIRPFVFDKLQKGIEREDDSRYGSEAVVQLIWEVGDLLALKRTGRFSRLGEQDDETLGEQSTSVDSEEEEALLLALALALDGNR